MLPNLVDTDSVYGHRNDPKNFAGALEAFDLRLKEMVDLMHPGDLMIITADHGYDPCDISTDHTPGGYSDPGLHAGHDEERDPRD